MHLKRALGVTFHSVIRILGPLSNLTSLSRTQRKIKTVVLTWACDGLTQRDCIRLTVTE
jgi:hypothetical protein